MPGFFLLICLAGCGEPPSADVPPAEPSQSESIAARLSLAGNLENEDIDEASGIASSRRSADILWTHNDSGAKARVYAIDTEGRSVGRIKLDDADNVDWEDIASFLVGDRAALLVADIGDNESRREHLSLYVVEEPDLDEDAKVELIPERRIDFRYPNGPRDAEAVAVDGDRALVLTKRDLPPVLYSVPLVSDGEVVTATRLAAVATLRRPTRQDVQIAPMSKDWYWQPTAMDIAPDGAALAILTYEAVYYYQREVDEPWEDVLARPPLALNLGSIRDAEAIAFDSTGDRLYLTVEQRNAPLIRIDIGESPQP